MNMKCWNVKCRSVTGEEYDVGVMCADEFSAMRVAENSLLEGRHIVAKARAVIETDGI